MLAANLCQVFASLKVCDKPLIQLSCKPKEERSTEVITWNPPIPTTIQTTVEEDMVEEHILLGTTYPTSLTQEKLLQSDIICRGFYTWDTDRILDVRITDVDNPTNKVQTVDKVLQEHDHRKKNLYL